MRATVGKKAAMIGVLASSGAAAQPAAMRAPLWQGVQRIALACEVDPAAGVSVESFCAAARDVLRARSPYPVEAAAVPRRGRDLAILTLSVARGAGAPTLAARVRRAVEIDESESAGIVPARPLGAGAAMAADLSAVIDRALPRPRVHAAP